MKLPIRASLEDIHNPNGLFYEMMDNCFDAAVLVDTNLRIIHHSAGAVELTGIPAECAAGMPIKDLDPVSDFEKVIRTGQDSHYSFTVVNGHNCIQHLIPIVDGDKVIASLGGILFRNLSFLKKILTEYDDTKEVNNFYNSISRTETNYTFNDFITQSPTLLRILDKCRKLAPLKHPVLIIGESGTGKEILASAIHAAGRKNHRAPLVKINCSAIPTELLESELFGHEKGAFTGAVSSKIGKFELAENGSILLDEIGVMDPKIQAKLLRVIEEKEFERVGGNRLIPLKARIIASTNKNLYYQCQQGTFRSDLYYRLCTFEINIPPLRDHRQDIPLILNHYMNKTGLTMRFSPKAMNLLVNYDWPGNVRQLRNVVYSLDILQDQEVIGEEVIREALKLQDPVPQTSTEENNVELFRHVASKEKELILRTLKETNMNVALAARQLNIHRRTLYNKIAKYGIRLDRHAN
jgi:transcriptional regulator with PAS, ATPase and Fis domain